MSFFFFFLVNNDHTTIILTILPAEHNLEAKQQQEARLWLFPLLSNKLSPSSSTSADYHELFQSTSLEQIHLALKRANIILSKQRYLIGNTIMTHVDLELLTSLIYLDDYFYTTKQIQHVSQNYPALVDYCRDIYANSSSNSSTLGMSFCNQEISMVGNELWSMVVHVPSQKRHLLLA